MCHFFPANFTFQSQVQFIWEIWHSRLPPGWQCRDNLFYLNFPWHQMPPLSISGVGFHRRALGGFVIPDAFNSRSPMVTIKCFLLFAEDLEDENIVHITMIPKVLTSSWLLIALYSLILAPGSMKSPNRTGWEGMTSSKVVPNSSIILFIRLSNQVRSSLLTRRSQKTRQLSWYHSLSRCSLFW